jgi:hypothetical protein
MSRKTLTYKQWVDVPEELKPVVWDALDGKAPLESMILKALKRQKLEYVEIVCRFYPEETLHVAEKYKDELHRGVVFWVKEILRGESRSSL